MKRYFMMFSAAVAALVSCHKEPNQEPVPEPQVESHEVTIEAGILSKTMLDGNAVMWEGSDEIALVFTHTSSAPHVNKTFVNQEAEQTIARALFKGQIPNNVSSENGYNDLGYAVYPKTAVTDKGVFSHNLPATQVAKANGSFPSGCNLSSAALALSEMGEGGSTKTDFRNALSVLRIALTSDVESVTVTGTAPLAGTAPLQMYYNASKQDDPDNGRLLVDAWGTWPDASTSVTLTPADGTVFENKTYNVLVWPGKQEGLTITLNFKNLGEYEKASSISTSKPATFKPAKFYNLNVKNTEELVVEEITGRLEELEGNIPNIDENIDDLDQTVQGLVNQIQSISLVSEYLDNAVYARYAQMTYSKQKMDLSLDYIVRPEAAAEALVEAFSQDSDVVAGLLAYSKGSGLEIQGTPLAVKGLLIKDVIGVGKVVTATIDASTIDNKFYDGAWNASVALQIADGKTDIMSDFANLVPRTGNAILGSNRIAAVPGARVVIPFNYSISGEVTPVLAVSDSLGVNKTHLQYGNNSGHLTVYFGDGEVGTPSVTLTLTVGEGESREVISHTFTFFDDGLRINVEDPGEVDYIGGDVIVNVTTQNIMSGGIMTLISGECEHSGNIFSFSQNNTDEERTASVEYSVPVGENTVIKDITLTQKAYGTELSRDYYTNGQKEVLNQANASGCSNYFNIVILGDGYQKRDLLVGGKFESRARSAMGSFFGIEPYKSYQNRFNVYMVAYESAEEGTDSNNEGIVKNTYFNTYHSGETQLWFGDGGVDKVKKAVTEVLGLDLYRTISIVLVNTDKNAGTSSQIGLVVDDTSYYGEPYKGFGVACVAANSTGTNGLVKHEAGGHAFGRLADEYLDGDDNIQKSYDGNLTDPHNKGQYRNVTTYIGYWNDLLSYPGYSSVISYVEGGLSCDKGIYRPTTGGMMFNNQGVFNAVCRRIIYERIIRQTEGAGAYSLSKFVEYDTINMPK